MMKHWVQLTRFPRNGDLPTGADVISFDWRIFSDVFQSCFLQVDTATPVRSRHNSRPQLDQWSSTTRGARFCDKIDELCAKVDELCAKSDELCAEHDGFVCKMMGYVPKMMDFGLNKQKTSSTWHRSGMNLTSSGAIFHWYLLYKNILTVFRLIRPVLTDRVAMLCSCMPGWIGEQSENRWFSIEKRWFSIEKRWFSIEERWIYAGKRWFYAGKRWILYQCSEVMKYKMGRIQSTDIREGSDISLCACSSEQWSVRNLQRACAGPRFCVENDGVLYSNGSISCWNWWDLY